MNRKVRQAARKLLNEMLDEGLVSGDLRIGDRYIYFMQRQSVRRCKTCGKIRG